MTKYIFVTGGVVSSVGKGITVASIGALLKNQNEVSFCEIESSYGHDAFLLEVDTLGQMIANFLKNRLEAING